MATVLPRTGLSIPDVGETGWGTATNLSFTTFDTNVAMQNKTNTFTQQLDIEAATILKNAIQLQGKDTGGTARSLITMTASDNVQLGSSSQPTTAVGKKFDIEAAPVTADGALEIGGQGGTIGGAHIKFTNDSTLVDGSSVDGQFWFTGTVLKLNVAGVVKTIDMT